MGEYRKTDMIGFSEYQIPNTKTWPSSAMCTLCVASVCFSGLPSVWKKQEEVRGDKEPFQQLSTNAKHPMLA